MLYSKQHAKEFFRAWREFSVEVLRHFGLPTSPGWKTKKWKFGRPKGVTEHFTAGVAWLGSINWLQSTNNRNSSCHAMILDRRVAEIDDIFSRYDILEPLPVLALLLADLDEGTWHATWSNNMNFGIENRNAGPLTQKNGKWHWWAGEFKHEKLGKMPVNIDGRWWEPYTYGQIVANVHICQMLHCLYQHEGGLDPSWLVPHSAIQPGKQDTGRVFPFHDVRAATFDQVPVSDLTWLHAFKADPMYMDDYDEEWDEILLEEMAKRQGSRDGELTDTEFADAIAVPPENLQALVQEGDWKAELDTVRWALSKLWYWVGDASGPTLDATTKLAVWQFQKCMGLKTDGIPGNKETQPALVKRLKQFQLWEDGRPWDS